MKRVPLIVGGKRCWRTASVLYSIVPALLLCLSLFVPKTLAASAVPYRGLTPGISTLQDTLRLLGKPVAKVYSDDRIVCKYRSVQVSIPKKSGKVQYILIFDTEFRDVNGFRLGSSYSEIRKKLNNDGAGNSIVDLNKGIGYIFDATGRVEQIVYGIVR